MNMQYLLEHTVQMTSAPLRVYTLNGSNDFELLCFYSVDGRPPAELTPEVLAFAKKHSLAPLPTLTVVDMLNYYAVIPQEETVYLLGPVHLSTFLSLRRTIQTRSTATALDGTTAICDAPVFYGSILLLHNVFSPKAIAQQELIAHNCIEKSNTEVQRKFSSLVYENRERGHRHNSYSQENRLMSSIERGDLKMVEKCQQERMTGAFGTLSADANRSVRNVCISVIVLASRAAIRGGVDPELAFSLCDSYIMKIEELQKLNELQPLVEGAQLNFASMVFQLRSNSQDRSHVQRHPLVEKSKKYIYAHLHEKITVNDVAAYLQTNPNYLSNQFKRFEGVTFSEFVVHEKIALAKSMLIYSQDSYGQISATLAFASQSHLGMHFKRLTGMTPIQFRKRFAPTELKD